MTAATRAARQWLNGHPHPAGAVRVVDVGLALGRRTGVVHHVADAAEVTVGDDTTLTASWLCGGSTIDAEVVSGDAEVACVGCRLAAAIPSGPVVYYAWNADDELLYVGSSIQASVRIRAHMSGTPWWSEVRRVTCEAFENEGEARRAELAAIGRAPGIYNREGRLTSVKPLPFVIGDQA